MTPPRPCFFTGVISAFIEHESCYLIDGVAINGVSGGPVFTDDDPPELIGSISAYLANNGGNTPGLLKAQDLSSLYEEMQNIKSFEESLKTDVSHSLQNDQQVN